MENERCIICHRETNIPCDTPIELRDNYIEGAGQLCSECALRQISEQLQNPKNFRAREIDTKKQVILS